MGWRDWLAYACNGAVEGDDAFRGDFKAARQEVDGQRRVGAEEIDRGRDKRVVHLVVFEKIARDEEGVGLVFDGQFERPTKYLQSRLAQPAAGRAKLSETCAQLPVGRVE